MERTDDFPGDKELLAGDELMRSGFIVVSAGISSFEARWKSRSLLVRFFWRIVNVSMNTRHLGTTGCDTSEDGKILDVFGYPMMEELDAE
jgi:hypothetical protein